MNEAKEGDVGDFFNVLIKAEGRIKHKVVTVNDQTGVLVELYQNSGAGNDMTSRFSQQAGL